MPRDFFTFLLATSMHHCLCLGIEIMPVPEDASCQEVFLCIGKVSFHPGFSIGIAHFMRDKLDPEDFSKMFHLRGDQCIGAAAVGHESRWYCQWCTEGRWPSMKRKASRRKTLASKRVKFG